MFVLTGPTAGGKTALALAIAEPLNAEIIALDSMTLYRGLDIGTAKPTRAEQQQVPHHLLDVLDPDESASVAWWLGQAQRIVYEIEGRGRRALFVGGTPFYLKALLHGLFASPIIDPAIRTRLEQEAVTLGVEALHTRLQAIDPITAARLHPNDVRRVIRALEVFAGTGQPISAMQQSWATPPRPIPAVLLEWPREELVQRIECRVDAMTAAGWLDECQRLIHQPLSKEARQAVGYQELFAHLRGELSLPDAIALIKTRTRQFAKRQMTWFRKLPLQSCSGSAANLAAEVIQYFQQAESFNPA